MASSEYQQLVQFLGERFTQSINGSTQSTNGSTRSSNASTQSSSGLMHSERKCSDTSTSSIEGWSGSSRSTR